MTMCTAGRALTWEYWRRGTIWLVLAVAVSVITCTGLLYASLLFVTGLSYADLRAELDAGLMAFILLPPVVLAGASIASSRRDHALPISTSLFVGCTLANGVLASVFTYWIIAIVLGKVLNANWPLLLPACWTATVYVVLQSLVWQAGRSRGLLVLLTALFLVLVMPLGIEYLLPHLLESDDRVERTGLTRLAETLLVCGTTWLLAYFLAVSGVARDRCGNVWSFGWLSGIGRLLRSLGVWLWPFAISKSPSARAYRSPHTAQFWLEWRAKGRIVFLFVLAVLGGLWVWLSTGQRTPENIDAAIGGLGGLLLFSTPFVGLYLGSDAGRFDRTAFAATRPLSDGAMASAVLKNVTAVVCSCSAAWLLGIVVALVVYRAGTSDSQQFQQAWAGGLPSFVRVSVGPTMRLFFGVCCYLLGVWTVLALAAALALARSWFVGVGGFSLLALIVSFLLIWNRTGLSRPAFAAVCLLGTLAAFLAAYRLRAISKTTIIACCAIYLLLCMVSMSAYALTHLDHRLPGYVQFILVGLCAIPFAPLAAAPCALSWNRHR